MLNHIIQELITKAIEKQTEKIITKKAQKKIGFISSHDI